MAVDDSGLEAIRKAAVEITPGSKANYKLQVDVVSTVGGGSGGSVTEYTEGDTDASITGVAILWEDTGETLATISAANPLPVTIPTFPLPTGASTAANQVTEIASLANIETSTATIAAVDFATQTTLAAINAKLVSGTDIGDVTINNASGASAVNVQDGGNSLTIDNSTLAVTGGGVEASALRVTIANDSTGVVSVDDNGGSLTVDGTVAVSGTVAVTQSGTWNITNVSGVVSLPTGAATAALQTQPGVDIGDVTINNASGAAAINIQDGGNSLTIDNAALSVVGGGVEATALRVTIASDSTGVLSIDDNGGSITVDGSVSVSGAVDTELTTADLDTGAGTDTRAVVGMVLAASGGGLLVGTANPMPISDNSGSITVDGTVAATQSGTWNITNVSGVVSLPTGAATSANQSTEITSLQLIDDIVHATNGALSKTAAIGGQLDDASITAATEDNVAPIRITAQRAMHTNLRNNSGAEIGISAAPIRTDPTGSTAQPVTDNGGSLTIDGTIAATQSGTWNITDISGTVSLPTGAATAARQDTQITSLQLIDDIVHATNGALNKAAAVGGQLDDTSTTAATEDNVAPARITAQRAFHVNLRNNSGTELGISATPVRIDPTGTTTQPISAASLPLPTGAATSALQTQPGVDIGDVTINNSTGAAAVNIQDGGNSITVDGTVAATQSGTWNINNVSGAVSLPTGASTETTSAAILARYSAATSTLSNVSASASSVTVLALNTARKSAIIYNDSTVGVYLKFGSAASATSFTYRLETKRTLIVDGIPAYTGIITGIWDSATGTARVTELTA